MVHTFWTLLDQNIKPDLTPLVGAVSKFGKRYLFLPENSLQNYPSSLYMVLKSAAQGGTDRVSGSADVNAH